MSLITRDTWHVIRGHHVAPAGTACCCAGEKRLREWEWSVATDGLWSSGAVELWICGTVELWNCELWTVNCGFVELWSPSILRHRPKLMKGLKWKVAIGRNDHLILQCPVYVLLGKISMKLTPGVVKLFIVFKNNIKKIPYSFDSDLVKIIQIVLTFGLPDTRGIRAQSLSRPM